MAGDDDPELELNTLHRFAKHSPRLVLEEYSHCEVPAGCGGAILRWRDPADGVPLQLVVAADGEVTALIDGAFVGSRFSLKPGAHTIAVALTNARTPAIALALREAGPGRDLNPGAILWVTGPDTRVTRVHTEGWGQAGFRDDHWQPPPRADVDLGSREWRFRQLENLGAQVVPTLGPDLWLRGTFEVRG
ncbi:MAG: hypothetical protein R3F61_35045 [Myxococcota bacterium]